MARAEIQTLQMNPDARGGGVEPADVHLGASSRLTCQQFIALENSVLEGAIASGGAYSREMVGCCHENGCRSEDTSCSEP